MQSSLRKRINVAMAALVFGLATALAAAAADSKPNFSGEWKLNVGKSDFGPMPAPTSRTDKIDHKDPSLKFTSTQVNQQGEFTREWSCTTDGKECTNTLMGNSWKSIAKWETNTLLIESKGSFNGNDVQTKEKWTLSEDGKTITISRHLASSMGEADQTIVFEKQ
jgi:hypothetical protein